jgi:hypothetical protein
MVLHCQRVVIVRLRYGKPNNAMIQWIQAGERLPVMKEKVDSCARILAWSVRNNVTHTSGSIDEKTSCTLGDFGDVIG